MSLSAYALTSLARVRQYLGDPAAEEGLLINLINSASEEIEHFCQRNFISRATKLWCDGIGESALNYAPFVGFVNYPDQPSTQELWLPNFPVTILRRVCVAQRDALKIANSSTDVAYAVAGASATALSLTVGGGANAGSSSLLFSDYATLTLLAAAVNALGKGWCATVITGADAWPSTELRPVSARGCLGSGYTFQAPDLPVDDCDVDEESGRLFRDAGWPQGKRNIFVDYTAGYAIADLPQDIEQVCVELVKRLYDQIEQDSNLSAESIAGHSWTALSAKDKNADLQQSLLAHRRIIL